ncbi:universal stress protein [Microbispora sp. RL4-1S]|uniref:Universal stress protein n=1 Tax=Microbispora oryzae TaxID=2806554 RepID=A0A940WNB1_9ACTN|nr:universal stress protein [Microbispora oryzae]MBP2706997.1 universal stress protein [Microbispora oryzae]
MSQPIIVGVDGSREATSAAEWAADDAARRACPLRLVSVVDHWAYGIPKFPSGAGDPLTLHSERALTADESVVRKRRPGVDVSLEIVEGIPAKVLRDKGREAVEIVVGSRGLGGFAGLVVGSVSTHVAGHTDCPVVVVRPGWRDAHGEVVVGVDDAPECEPALAYAFEQARLRGATLRAIFAWRVPVYTLAPEVTYDIDEVMEAQQRAVSERLANHRRDNPEVAVREDLVYGHPAQALAEASGTADLLVVGSHGRGALGTVALGSVSRAILHHSACPVAVVRPRD